MKISRKHTTIIAASTILLTIIADQMLKIWVKTSMLMYERICLASDWAYLLFTENDGMAFSFDFISTEYLTLFRLIAISLLTIYLVRLVRTMRPLLYIVCIALVLAGALGNVIDNCFYGLIFTASTPYALAEVVPIGEGYAGFLSGHVVDMFYFPIIDTTLPGWVPIKGGERFVFFSPIFNLADAAISCGAIFIALFCRKQLSEDLEKKAPSGEVDAV